MKRYTLDDPKPSFKQGEQVAVDMGWFGCTDLGVLQGRIVGKALTHVLDVWLVDFGREISSEYPYYVLSVPHTAMLK